MKLTFRLREERALTPAEAKGCLWANIALPGAGTLAAGKSVGYWQMLVATVGFIISLIYCIGAIQWLVNGGIDSAGGDPVAYLANLWSHAKGMVLGLLVFLIAMVWGIVTGMQLMARARNPAPPPII